ncbi:MAG: BrnA antitoxin family protein [Deltaproteobacteria bacterium]|nr:BrnA antitoxin family protein [Deltaproteobacteria bacterium]
MSTIVTMSLDEINKLPPLTEEELRELEEAEPVPDEDCPALTPEQLAQFRPWHEVCPHRGRTRPEKTAVSIRIDSDVLEWYKSQGPGYQTRINEVLRAAAFREGADGQA